MTPKLPNIKPPVINTVVSDEMINYYFENTNFGPNKSTVYRRELLANGVLKNQAGYWNGSTLFNIMKSCNLVTKRGNITKRGRLFIYEYFSSNNVQKELYEHGTEMYKINEQMRESWELDKPSCAFCGSENIFSSKETEVFVYGAEGNPQLEISAKVMVTTCNDCNQQSTDSAQEDARTEAIINALYEQYREYVSFKNYINKQLEENNGIYKP